MAGNLSEKSSLDAVLAALKQGRAVARSSWPDAAPDPQQIGLSVQAGQVLPPPGALWVDARRLNDDLPAGWQAEVLLSVGSTNTRLMERCREASVHGQVLTAEFQSLGRGRRGRQWVGPVARNVALSLGFATTQPPFRLGSASLVVGLAVREALAGLGAEPLALKWPNDVLSEAAKVCGILVEVGAGEPNHLIVGIGVNVEFADRELERLDREATDLRRLGVTATRGEICAEIVHKVVEYLAQYDRLGFAPFAPAFDEVHAYHGQQCRIQSGASWVDGQVLGVKPDGRLRLLTERGEEAFAAGEVSLRPK